MCIGRVEGRKDEWLSEEEVCVCEDNNHDQSSRFSSSSLISCQLCDSEASIYCQADDAFLCGKCDPRVHAANFLAQRHIRCFLCTNCVALTHRYLIGLSVQLLLPTIVCKKEIIRNRNKSHVESNYSNQLMIRPVLFL